MIDELTENTLLTHDGREEGMPDPEYLYGRARLDPSITNHLLHRDDAVGRLAKDGSAEMIFYKYARTKAKAQELPRLIRAFASELNELAYDLEYFIENHSFPTEGPTEGECDDRPA